MTTKLQKVEVVHSTEEIEGEDLTPKVGQWYWVRHQSYDDDDQECVEEDLACVSKVGSNYAEVTYVGSGSSRIHFDEFTDYCRPEKNPDKVIEEHIAKYQNRAAALMGKVKELTLRLSVAPREQLAEAAPETQALAVLSTGRDLDEYQKALVKAKEKQLPDLFAEIKKNHEAMAEWMTAKTIPLKAEAKKMTGVIENVESRIFSVELYAGLTEQVEQITEGEPAPSSTKLHIMQRRCYMDEECLSRYETGGMAFDNLGEFDRWLAKEENRDRLLPFPRTIVAFRVRRNKKRRKAAGSLLDFIRILNLEEDDKKTFLYLRNGQNLYRMTTKLEFEHKIFPDHDRSIFDEDLMASVFCNRVDKLITRREYDAMIEKYGEDHWTTDRYESFSPDSVYYDDIAKHVAEQIQYYNRIALIVQGLFDRSPVFDPHWPVKMWTPDGFNTAVKLVFDADHALHAGPKPSFKAYFAKLNRKIREGCVLLGQERAWLEAEADKENRRRRNSWKYRGEERDLETFQPYGNPGPGFLALPTKVGTKNVKFEWMRERLTRKKWRSDPDEYPVKFNCDRKKLFNITDYKPGDFKQFFEDPRTRAEYIQWAPMMLAAEEFHAGNYTVGGKNRDLLGIEHCFDCGADYREKDGHECPQVKRTKKKRKKRRKR